MRALLWFVLSWLSLSTIGFSGTLIKELTLMTPREFDMFDEIDAAHPKGWTLQYLEKALGTQGVKLKFVYSSWSRCIETAKRGKVDGVYPLIDTPDKGDDFKFTSPLLRTAVYVYKHSDNHQLNFNGKLESLAGLHVGYIRGTVIHPKFTEGKFTRVEVNDQYEGFKMLYAKRLDALVMSSRQKKSLTFKEIKNEPGLQDIEEKIIAIQPPLHVYGMSVAISKSLPHYEEKVQLINRAMETLKMPPISTDY